MSICIRSTVLHLFLSLLINLSRAEMNLVKADDEQVFTLGIPLFAERENILSGSSEFSLIVRDATAPPLLVSEGSDSAGFRLSVIDSFRVEERPRRWMVRLRSSATFSNGRRVTPSDISWSLQRCAARESKIRVEISPRGIRDGGAWIEISSEAPDGGGVERLLKECPIIEQESAKVFGTELGVGTAFVGVGPFQIDTFRPGKEIALRRRVSTPGYPNQIFVRGIASPERGLDALRSGSIDALVGLNEDVARRVEKDETLKMVRCSISNVAIRRGVEAPCGGRLVLKGVRYARS